MAPSFNIVGISIGKLSKPFGIGVNTGFAGPIPQRQNAEIRLIPFSLRRPLQAADIDSLVAF